MTPQDLADNLTDKHDIKGKQGFFDFFKGNFGNKIKKIAATIALTGILVSTGMGSIQQAQAGPNAFKKQIEQIDKKTSDQKIEIEKQAQKDLQDANNNVDNPFFDGQYKTSDVRFKKGDDGPKITQITLENYQNNLGNKDLAQKLAKLFKNQDGGHSIIEGIKSADKIQLVYEKQNNGYGVELKILGGKKGEGDSARDKNIFITMNMPENSLQFSVIEGETVKDEVTQIEIPDISKSGIDNLKIESTDDNFNTVLHVCSFSDSISANNLSKMDVDQILGESENYQVFINNIKTLDTAIAKKSYICDKEFEVVDPHEKNTFQVLHYVGSQNNPDIQSREFYLNGEKVSKKEFENSNMMDKVTGFFSSAKDKVTDSVKRSQKTSGIQGDGDSLVDSVKGMFSEEKKNNAFQKNIEGEQNVEYLKVPQDNWDVGSALNKNNNSNLSSIGNEEELEGKMNNLVASFLGKKDVDIKNWEEKHKNTQSDDDDEDFRMRS